MKRILFGILIIVLIGFGIFIASNTPQKGASQSELSQRAKEFLKKQQTKGNLEFSGVDPQQETKKEKIGSESIDVGDCFSVSIPFTVEENKELGKCFNQVVITSPRGMVNVYSRDVSYASLDDDSGVKMRRNETKTYKEEKKVINGRTFYTFKRTDGGYEKTALYLGGGRQIGIVLLSSLGDDRLDEKFLKMLESVELR